MVRPDHEILVTMRNFQSYFIPVQYSWRQLTLTSKDKNTLSNYFSSSRSSIIPSLNSFILHHHFILHTFFLFFPILISCVPFSFHVSHCHSYFIIPHFPFPFFLYFLYLACVSPQYMEHLLPHCDTPFDRNCWQFLYILCDIRWHIWPIQRTRKLSEFLQYTDLYWRTSAGCCTKQQGHTCSEYIRWVSSIIMLGFIKLIRLHKYYAYCHIK